MSTVEQVLDERSIRYFHSGKDLKIKCLNPDHEDQNPSMRVDRVLGIFHCFSCGYKGNLFQHYNVETSKVGILREKLKRKIDNIRSSGVGLSMPEDYTLYKRDWRGISAETYEHFNAFSSIDQRFAGRVNFPITDASSRIIGFIGRDETGTLSTKYMFTPSGVKLPLFPLANPIQGRVILVEGIFDVLNLYDKGLTNAICCFGVNNFTQEKFDLLRVSGVSGIDLLFDADDAGKQAVNRVKKLVGDFPLKTVTLKSGDPGDLNLKQVQNLRKKLYG